MAGKLVKRNGSAAVYKHTLPTADGSEVWFEGVLLGTDGMPDRHDADGGASFATEDEALKWLDKQAENPKDPR